MSYRVDVREERVKRPVYGQVEREVLREDPDTRERVLVTRLFDEIVGYEDAVQYTGILWGRGDVPQWDGDEFLGYGEGEVAHATFVEETAEACHAKGEYLAGLYGLVGVEVVPVEDANGE